MRDCYADKDCKHHQKDSRYGADSPFAVFNGFSGNGRCASRVARHRHDGNADTSPYSQQKMVQGGVQGEVFALPHYNDGSKLAYACINSTDSTQRNVNERSCSTVYVRFAECDDRKRASPCYVALVVYIYGYPCRTAP